MPAPRCAAVVTAAGASSRMGGAVKKEFRSLGGVPVLALAIRPFLSGIAERVVVTLPAGRIDEAAALLAPHLDVSALLLVEGGGTRQESVRLGLAALAADPPDIVLIHDGARPWLSTGLASRVAGEAARSGACVPAVEATEAVKEVDDGPVVVRHIPRPGVRFAQTPQGFSYARLLEAHERARASGLSFADDAEVYDRFEGPVTWVPGDPSNRKITFTEDLEEAP